MQNLGEIEAILGEMVSEKTPQRIQLRTINGEKYWFKQYSTNHASIYLMAHRLVSFLLPFSFLKAAPPYSGVKAMQIEIARMKEFEAAGFSTPQTITTRDNILVSKHAGETYENIVRVVRKSGQPGHDDMLCEWAGIFGNVHAKGLTHGRPHPRDVIYNDKDWVFFDFEENPQHVMGLRTAQARDLLLIFLVLSKMMLDSANLDKAMQAYRANAPMEVLDEMRVILDKLRPIIFIAKLAAKIRAGKDLRGFILATNFLKQNLEIE